MCSCSYLAVSYLAHRHFSISDVPIEIFLRFNKISRLVSSAQDIAKAIKKSEVLELSEDSLKVQRKAPLKIKENEDDCTIYVVCYLFHYFTNFG